MMASLRAAAVVVVLCMMVMLCTAYVPVCKDKREQDVCKSARCDADYYKRSCRKTCGLCHVCMDVRADCSTLRARCNETWMKQDCSKTCKECKDGNTEDYGIGDDTTTLTATVCLMAPPRGNCIVLRNSWYYEPLEGKCRIFTYGCHDDGNNIFQTEENCNRYCRAFDICRQPNGARSCTRPQSRYYYDSDVNECRQFSGCDGSLNNFISLEACQRKCGPEPSAGKTKEACSLVRHDGVTCTDRFTATNTYWYYDNHSGRCQQFTYTGCGGNGNRFDTEQSCTALCSMSASTTPTPQAVWGEWSPWTECSATCGSGTTTTRTRTCMPPGGTCQGLSTNAVVCNLKACCVLQDGTWSDWNDWSPCSRSCDRGNRRRQRTCSSPNECGRPCAGSNTQDDYCNTQACPSIPQITVRPQTQPFSAGDSVTLTCRSTNTGGARGDLSWSFSPGDIGREQPAVDSIKLQISNLSTELDGTNVTCRERVGAEEKHTSVVIRVDQKAVLGVCKASVNSDNWTIAGFCDVTNVYDSSGQYLCVWQEENYRYYSYASMTYPERPTVTCPGTYLGEGSPFECTCQTSSLGTPVGRLLLKVKDQLEATGSVGETSIRLSRNIRREDSSARVTCLVDWAKNVTGRNEAQLLVSKYAAWGEWDNWSTCSATCGNGTQSRRRTCYPTRSTCHGSNTETASCNFTDCCDVLPSTPRLTMVSPMLAYRCAPRLISSTIMTTEVVEGSDGQFTFDLVAYPLPSVDTFTYRRDNSTSRSQQEPVRSSLLSGRCEDHAYVLHLVTCKVDITGAALNDGGLYSFQARNAEGQQSVTFRLSVTPQDTNSSDQDNPLSFIGFAIAVLVLAFIAALVVFIIKRRSAASGANAEEPTYCNVTMQSVASACASDNNLHDNIEKNTSTQDSKEPGSSKVSDENTVNDLYAVVEKTKTPGFFENSGQPGTSKSPDEDTQNDLYGTVDKSRKAKSAGNKEKQAKPAVMPKPMRKGAAGRKPQENDGDSLSANATDTIRGSGVENVVNNNEAGPCDSQKATANEEGLFYTELDFSQYRPETQRPLPQKEETLYATVDLQKTAATCIKRQH